MIHDSSSIKHQALSIQHQESIQQASIQHPASIMPPTITNFSNRRIYPREYVTRSPNDQHFIHTPYFNTDTCEFLTISTNLNPKRIISAANKDPKYAKLAPSSGALLPIIQYVSRTDDINTKTECPVCYDDAYCVPLECCGKRKGLCVECLNMLFSLDDYNCPNCRGFYINKNIIHGLTKLCITKPCIPKLCIPKKYIDQFIEVILENPHHEHHEVDEIMWNIIERPKIEALEYRRKMRKLYRSAGFVIVHIDGIEHHIGSFYTKIKIRTIPPSILPQEKDSRQYMPTVNHIHG